MANYTHLKPPEVVRIASLYGISDVTGIQSLAGGAANSSFLINTSSDDYVLSVCDEKKFKDAENLSNLTSVPTLLRQSELTPCNN